MAICWFVVGQTVGCCLPCLGSGLECWVKNIFDDQNVVCHLIQYTSDGSVMPFLLQDS